MLLHSQRINHLPWNVLEEKSVITFSSRSHFVINMNFVFWILVEKVASNTSSWIMRLKSKLLDITSINSPFAGIKWSNTILPVGELILSVNWPVEPEIINKMSCFLDYFQTFVLLLSGGLALSCLSPSHCHVSRPRQHVCRLNKVLWKTWNLLSSK